MVIIIHGNLLESKEKYIAHQCNCLTQSSAGIAKNIFDKYPYANTYSSRTEPDTLASIKILGDSLENRFVINMFAQYYPGKPKYPESKLDGILARQQYFYQCLLKIAKISDLESIAFPYKIGCNLAGGDWNYYYGVLNNFANHVHDKYHVKTFLYHKD